MEASLFVLLSGTLTFGVPLIFGVHELLTLRPGGGDGGRDPAPEIVPPPPSPGEAPSPKPLPACLIPNLPPLPVGSPVRELEPV
jgi:hypothetical protein